MGRSKTTKKKKSELLEEKKKKSKKRKEAEEVEKIEESEASEEETPKEAEATQENQEVQEVLEEAEKIKEKLEEGKMRVPLLVVELKGKKYELIKDDGVSFSHTGWFYATEEKISCSELFYAYTLIKEKDLEYDRIEPFLLIFEYDKEGKIISSFVRPLSELNVIELGKTIAKVSKKSIGESSLQTQLRLETAVKLLKELPSLDLKELYERIKNKILYYIDFEDDIYYDLIVLWIMGTYFSDVFRVYPNLFIFGPSGSGKTRLTKLIVFTSRRGWMIVDPTDANLPRIIDGYRPTLGLDDFDNVLRKHFPAVLSLLKHTYKEGIQIPRLEKVMRGNKFLLSLFSPYAPVVINSTDPILESQLISRYVRIDMTKSKKKFPKLDPDAWYTEKEREDLYIMRFLFAPKVYEIFSKIETGLIGRDDEIWSPLLTIAKLISDELFEKVRQFAIKESARKEEELYPEEKLIIQGIERLMGNQEIVEFTAGELLDAIHDILIENKELTEKQFEKEWNSRKLGKILERMHIPVKRSKKRIRIVDRKLLNKLKDTYDVCDVFDVSNAPLQETKPLQTAELSQNSRVYESENIDRYTKETSQTSKTSTHLSPVSSEVKQEDMGQVDTKELELTDKDKLALYSKIEKDIIELVKNSPFQRTLYDFEIEAYLSQREYKPEDIRKVLKRLINYGILVMTPNGSLDVNFSKLLGGSS